MILADVIFVRVVAVGNKRTAVCHIVKVVGIVVIRTVARDTTDFLVTRCLLGSPVRCRKFVRIGFTCAAPLGLRQTGFGTGITALKCRVWQVPLMSLMSFTSMMLN
jgi:hypothetical protein